MNKLQLPHAKLFYLISEMFKNDEINEEQKIKLKESVIKLNQHIFKCLDEYNDNNNMEVLKESLIKMVEMNN